MNLDQLARYIDHVSTNEDATDGPDLLCQSAGRPPGRRRRVLVAAVCLVVVSGLAVAISANRGGDSVVLTVGSAEHGTNSTGNDQRGIDPPVMSSQYREGPPTVLSTETPYARAIASVLKLSELKILRRDRTAADGTSLVSDEVNSESPGVGYQATIYHGMPAVFVQERKAAQVPSFETRVGKAWWGRDDDRMSVSLANTTTGIIVEMSFLDPSGHLPSREAVVDKAIELSSNKAVLEEVLGKNAAFCDEAPDPSTEVAESHLGSTEHVKKMKRLRALAPDLLKDDLTAIIKYFDEVVHPSDPDSQLTENFPGDISAAIGRVTTFIDENCGA